ncbi:hypothetical protein C8J56DRAFT_896568 [Mycena floridula]|nr:hypothetical protein C8J56DRAFT_896568 [Mycena floridula]
MSNSVVTFASKMGPGAGRMNEKGRIRQTVQEDIACARKMLRPDQYRLKTIVTSDFLDCKSPSSTLNPVDPYLGLFLSTTESEKSRLSEAGHYRLDINCRPRARGRAHHRYYWRSGILGAINSMDSTVPQRIENDQACRGQILRRRQRENAIHLWENSQGEEMQKHLQSTGPVGGGKLLPSCGILLVVCKDILWRLKSLLPRDGRYGINWKTALFGTKWEFGL